MSGKWPAMSAMQQWAEVLAVLLLIGAAAALIGAVYVAVVQCALVWAWALAMASLVVGAGAFLLVATVHALRGYMERR